MVQKVAVIGAGISGLTSIKACLDEGLVSPVLRAAMTLEVCGDLRCQSLRLYTQAFKLLQHIRFQTSVVSVTHRLDFAATGQWEVETERREGQRETHVFDAVIVCTGHFTQPHLPLGDFPGIERFLGRYFHSWDYRNTEGLQGKRVVVIGIGSSGGDIAVEISRVAEKVYLCTRSRAWVVVEYDAVEALPLMECQDVGEKRFFSQNAVVNDDLPARIISGRVQVKPNVKEFCGSSVVFVDGSIIDKVDVVVFATGYNYSFPFLPSSLQAKCGYRLRLYKHVFPPALTQPTLALVGFVHALGFITPLAEMQARWATRVFKGLTNLPSEETMLEEIDKDTATMHQRYACSERTPIQVDYIPYLDSLAEQVGVRPNILWLMMKDPKLALQVLLGPCTSYQYRLTGPGQWVGARHAILTQWERVLQPFKTRVLPETRPSSRRSLIVIFSGAALLCCFFFNKHCPSFHSVVFCES